jgi:hypothetical protein
VKRLGRDKKTSRARRGAKQNAQDKMPKAKCTFQKDHGRKHNASSARQTPGNAGKRQGRPAIFLNDKDKLTIQKLQRQIDNLQTAKTN